MVNIAKLPEPDAIAAPVVGEVRAAMGRAGISGRQLAFKLGENQAFMSRRLTGEVEFSVADLIRVAAAIGVHPASFFPGDDKGPLKGGLSLSDAELRVISALRGSVVEPAAEDLRNGWAPSGSNRRPKDYLGDGIDDDLDQDDSPPPIADLDFERTRRRPVQVEVSA